MNTVEILAQAQKIYAEWEANPVGCFMEHYEMKSGNELDSPEYELVYEATTDGLIG